MSQPLLGKTIAIIAHGSPLDRAISVCLAEAGADIAIATEAPVQEQEFGTASIANEVWAIGRDQFSYVLDASSATAVSAFGAEVASRLAGCEGLVVVQPGTNASVAGDILPAFVRGLGKDVRCVVVGPAGAQGVTAPDDGADLAVAGAVLEQLA